MKYRMKNKELSMRKLALSDDILLKSRKACPLYRRRGEFGDEGQGAGGHPFAMCFPDAYEIGDVSSWNADSCMTCSTGGKTSWCERVYSPWIDLDKIMREENIPLFALESQDPVRGFRFSGGYDPVRDVLHEYSSGSGTEPIFRSMHLIVTE